MFDWQTFYESGLDRRRVRNGIQPSDWISLAARAEPQRVALRDHAAGTQHTYAQTEERVLRLANALAQVVQHGDRLAVIGVDSHRYVEAMYASYKLGTIFVPLNCRLTRREIEPLLDLAQPQVIFVSRRYMQTATDWARTRPSAPRVVVFDDAPDSDVVPYESLIASSTSSPMDTRHDDEDILTLMFTSGTTGRPKGVLQSQRMIANRMLSSVAEYGIGRDEVRYSPSPLFHVGGQMAVNVAILRCATSILNAQFDRHATWRWMQDTLTSCFLVPTMLSSILELPEAESVRYERLRVIAYGAAPMPAALLQRAIRVFDCDFIQAYAAGTEGGGSTFLTPDDHRRALAGEPHLLDSIGRPGMGVELQLRDEYGRQVPPGRIAEIVTRSNYFMSGYLPPELNTGKITPDGWFRTGDLARANDDGYLFLAGRADDMIVRGGENIHPHEIEQVIGTFPNVEEVFVVGVDDPHWGQIVRACIRFEPGTPVQDPEILRDHCRGQLAAFKVPSDWVFANEFPRNAAGKVLRRDLKRLPSSAR